MNQTCPNGGSSTALKSFGLVFRTDEEAAAKRRQNFFPHSLLAALPRSLPITFHIEELY